MMSLRRSASSTTRERRHVIVEAAHLDQVRRHEAVAPGVVGGADAVDLERHHVGDLGLGPEGADDGVQRPHPAQAPRLFRARAPAHRFRPRKIADDARQDLGDDLGGRASGTLDHRHVELALLRVLVDARLIERGEAGALQETLHGVVGRADARAAPLLAHVLPLGGQARDLQGQPARRRKGAGALVEEAALDQRVGDELAQILGRAALHAGRDLLGKQFKQQIGHQAASLPPSVLSQAAPQALASSRTRRM
jgi:hypothetical protein